MYSKSCSSSLVSIPNEVRSNLWLSSTSDAEKSMRLYLRFPGKELSPISSVKMLTLADKCVVVEFFVCGFATLNVNITLNVKMFT